MFVNTFFEKTIEKVTVFIDISGDFLGIIAVFEGNLPFLRKAGRRVAQKSINHLIAFIKSAPDYRKSVVNTLNLYGNTYLNAVVHNRAVGGA